jgi:hypothetical protein
MQSEHSAGTARTRITMHPVSNMTSLETRRTADKVDEKTLFEKNKESLAFFSRFKF